MYRGQPGVAWGLKGLAMRLRTDTGEGKAAAAASVSDEALLEDEESLFRFGGPFAPGPFKASTGPGLF